MRVVIEEFIEAIAASTGSDELAAALAAMTLRMGFSFYALTHHVDILRRPEWAIRLHNYPDQWADYFDRNRLGVSDPIHRASQLTSIGFAWKRLPGMISLTPADHRVLSLARDQGIGDGFTVPAHVPGEAHGSCSFAVAPGQAFPAEALPLAQLAGAFAFEGARGLWRLRDGPAKIPAITDRQRDCLLWVARGKTDWEISRILGVSAETVVQHVKQARERYGVHKRTSLLIRALFDGTLSFTDILRR
jgi:DNA-binding CsgD family transcriptional regulator